MKRDVSDGFKGRTRVGDDAQLVRIRGRGIPEKLRVERVEGDAGKTAGRAGWGSTVGLGNRTPGD